MFYPTQKHLPRSRETLERFYGLEHRANVREGALYEAENLSADARPLLRTRPARKQWTRKRGGEAQPLRLDSPVTAAAEVNGGLCLCSETGVYLGGRRVEDCAFDLRPARRRILPFGRNLFIAPDGKYITVDGNGVPRTRHAAFCKRDVNVQLAYGFAPGVEGTCAWHAVGDAPPENPYTGMLWLDTGGAQPVLARRGENGWEQGTKVFLILTGDGIGDSAEAGDDVLLAGVGDEELSYTAAFAERDKIWLAGKYLPLRDLSATVTLRKIIPLLDHAVEHNNRIWGCRYGENARGEFVNEIYASALGDPTAWEQFEGSSTDSYCVSLGCSGAFTGICVLDGALLFFKENYIIRVTGGAPAEYTVTVLPARGVAEGAEDSLVTLNERACYVSLAGVMTYDGALPALISEAVEDYRFSDTAAGAGNGKYYLAATVQDGGRGVFVYDAGTGLWQKETLPAGMRRFVSLGGSLYYLCAAADEACAYSLLLSDGSFAGAAADLLQSGTQDETYAWTEEAPFNWYALTGPLDPGSRTKILRRLVFRLELPEDSAFSAALLPDGEGREIPLCRVFRPAPGVFSVPVNTPRCHSYRLRLWGRGPCTLYAITAVAERTGEVSGLGT